MHVTVVSNNFHPSNQCQHNKFAPSTISARNTLRQKMHHCNLKKGFTIHKETNLSKLDSLSQIPNHFLKELEQAADTGQVFVAVDQ